MTCPSDHSHLLFLLKNGKEKGFEIIYDRFADRLYDYVFRRVKVKEVSEEIVQEVFISLWGKRKTVEIRTSLDAYLFVSARYAILTHFRSERVRRSYAEHFSSFLATRNQDNSMVEMMDLQDLEYSIDTSIARLPEKCRTAFRLSRIEHEPIPRIAERMNISKRTVENYLSQAMRHLRTSLGDFLMLLITILIGVR